MSIVEIVDPPSVSGAKIPGMDDLERKEREETAKGYWQLLAIIAVIVILYLIWCHPGDGSYLN